MARPSKYNWEAIRKSYEDGFDINKLCDMYSIEKKTIQNRISSEKWEVTGNINTDINEFKDSLGKIAGYVSQNDEIKNNEIILRVSTILEDNELIINNRKILKAFQGKIIAGLKNGAYEKPNDIKAGTSALKNIEAIANPQANKQEINIQNTNNQQTNIEVENMSQKEIINAYMNIVKK